MAQNQTPTSAAAEPDKATGSDSAPGAEPLAVLAHELRTPLAAIRLWASVLRANKLGSADAIGALDAILAAVDEQERLIDRRLESQPEPNHELAEAANPANGR